MNIFFQNIILIKSLLLCSCVPSVASEQSSSECVYKKDYSVFKKVIMLMCL